MARTVLVTGGTGFVGRHLANRLVADGWQVRIPSRHRERHRDLLVLPTVEVIEADVHIPHVLCDLLSGCDAVINLVGILTEGRGGNNNFQQAHVELPRKILRACQDTGVRRLLHMSALGADAGRAPSRYLRTKGEAENLVHQVQGKQTHVTSFRPSVIFGPDDSFFNRFATLLRLSPYVFPLACADTRFAPVFVGDVAHAIAVSIDNPDTFGRHYDLCGPQVFTLVELVQYTAQTLGLKRRVIGLGRGLSRMQAVLLEHVPGKPFTRDNFLSMQIDSVCGRGFPELFGITPATVDSIVPQYLGLRGQRQRYNRLRSRRDQSS